MGLVHAEIELISTEDVMMARKHLIGEEEIKRITVRMLVDSGAYSMAINENIQEYLQLPVVDRKEFYLADGRMVMCDVVSPLDVRFANRSVTCRAVVLPGDAEPLMGSIAMEELDVIIHPKRQEMVVNPEPYYRLPSLRPVR